MFQNGKHDIMYKLMKLARYVLYPYLTNFFTKCIKQEIFPDDFKVAFIIPIPKTSSPKPLNDFCSISLLSIFAKLFKKNSQHQNVAFLNKNNLLTPFQFGIR